MVLSQYIFGGLGRLKRLMSNVDRMHLRCRYSKLYVAFGSFILASANQCGLWYAGDVRKNQRQRRLNCHRIVINSKVFGSD